MLLMTRERVLLKFLGNEVDTQGKLLEMTVSNYFTITLV